MSSQWLAFLLIWSYGNHPGWLFICKSLILMWKFTVHIDYLINLFYRTQWHPKSLLSLKPLLLSFLPDHVMTNMLGSEKTTAVFSMCLKWKADVFHRGNHTKEMSYKIKKELWELKSLDWKKNHYVVWKTNWTSGEKWILIHNPRQIPKPAAASLAKTSSLGFSEMSYLMTMSCGGSNGIR